MIYEAIVTSKYRDRFNIAPMGIRFYSEDTILISPYNTSHTYIGLKETGECVVNFVDNVEIFARSVIGDEVFPWYTARYVDGWILRDAYMYMETEVEKVSCAPKRTSFRMKVLHKEVLRTPFMFNRAQYIVIEGAILVSRIGIYPCKKIRDFFERNGEIVFKTGGNVEIRAWEYLILILKREGIL